MVWGILGVPNRPYKLKNAVKKVLGRAFVSLSTLQTITAEIEAHLNNHPIKVCVIRD